jgi:hypothetical protein
MNFGRIYEMSRPSYSLVGRLCANILEQRSKIDNNWRSEESLKEVVKNVIQKGKGTDENFKISYTEIELNSPNRFEAYLNDVFNVMQSKTSLADELVVSTLRRLFKDQFRSA